MKHNLRSEGIAAEKRFPERDTLRWASPEVKLEEQVGTPRDSDRRKSKNQI